MTRTAGFKPNNLLTEPQEIILSATLYYFQALTHAERTLHPLKGRRPRNLGTLSQYS